MATGSFQCLVNSQDPEPWEQPSSLSSLFKFGARGSEKLVQGREINNHYSLTAGQPSGQPQKTQVDSRERKREAPDLS